MTWDRADRGGGGRPMQPAPSPAGHDQILCCVCSRPVAHPTWPDAWCWRDPGGETVAAHGDCLRALGEKDLGLVDR